MSRSILIVLLALFIVAAPLAYRALRELVPESRRAVFIGLAVWALLSFPADAVLGFVLKATTHHRGLGGATFGALALGVNLVALLLGWRVATARN